MEHVSFVEIIHIAARNDVYFLIPVLVQWIKASQLLPLYFGKLRKVLVDANELRVNTSQAIRN